MLDAKGNLVHYQEGKEKLGNPFSYMMYEIPSVISDFLDFFTLSD